MAHHSADFRNLVVWRRAHLLTLDVYRHSRAFPSDERYALTSQIRRAVCAIPTNLAEGCARGSARAYAASVGVALGSAGEVDYQLLLARDLGYLGSIDYAPMESEIRSIRGMLGALRQTLSRA